MLLVPSSESSLYGEMMSMARMDGWEALYNINAGTHVSYHECDALSVE